MQKTTLIIMAAGKAERFRNNIRVKKQWLRVGSIPLWLHVAERLSRLHEFEQVIVTADSEELDYARRFESDNIMIVQGGDTRWDSLCRALTHCRNDFVLVSDAARPCVPEEVITRVLMQKGKDCVVPSLPVHDTSYYGDSLIKREALRRIQTPQLSRVSCLRAAQERGETFSDESSAISAVGGEVLFVEGSESARKITHLDDLTHLACLPSPANDVRVGQGMDIHAFETGKPMILGGVMIQSDVGFKAHSDGDVLIHAVIDALLGAAGAGDIGEWFPDNDPTYKGADSAELLARVVQFLHAVGFAIINVDVTVNAETPRLSPYKQAINARMAELLGIRRESVNIKATTAEKMGFVGRKEGVMAMAVCSIKYLDWTVA